MARQDRAVIGLATQIHEILFWLTMLAAAGHVVMALWHQFAQKDNLLARMKF